MDHKELAAELFLTDSNCAQAIVAAYCDVTGMDKSFASKLASSFGGGMGRMREVCGAVSGMLMVAGLLYGYDDPGENDVNKKRHYQLVQELAGRFREKAGSIVCREILGNPPSDPAPTPRTAEFYKIRPCARLVVTAAEILDDYIRQHPLKARFAPELLSERWSVRPMGAKDMDSILRLCSGNEIYYRYHPPFATKESILEDLEALPPHKAREDKFYVGFFRENTLLAVMDLILGYPRDETAFIGFFMTDKAFQGQGIGSGIISDCAACLSRLGFSNLRLAVDKGNPQSIAFWRKNGFRETGEEIPNDFSAYLPMERTL